MELCYIKITKNIKIKITFEYFIMLLINLSYLLYPDQKNDNIACLKSFYNEFLKDINNQ